MIVSKYFKGKFSNKVKRETKEWSDFIVTVDTNAW